MEIKQHLDKWKGYCIQARNSVSSKVIPEFNAISNENPNKIIHGTLQIYSNDHRGKYILEI